MKSSVHHFPRLPTKKQVPVCFPLPSPFAHQMSYTGVLLISTGRVYLIRRKGDTYRHPLIAFFFLMEYPFVLLAPGCRALLTLSAFDNDTDFYAAVHG